MVKMYFKVINSIIIALILLSVAFSIPLVIYAVNTTGVGFFNALLFPFIASFYGFIIFGFTGAFSWVVMFKLLPNIFAREINKHIISAISSIFIVFFALLFSLYKSISLEDILRLFRYVIIVLPVTILSIYIYNKKYIKIKS